MTVRRCDGTKVRRGDFAKEHYTVSATLWNFVSSVVKNWFFEALGYSWCRKAVAVNRFSPASLGWYTREFC